MKNGKTFNTEEPEAAEELKVTAEIKLTADAKTKAKPKAKAATRKSLRGNTFENFSGEMKYAK